MPGDVAMGEYFHGARVYASRSAIRANGYTVHDSHYATCRVLARLQLYHGIYNTREMSVHYIAPQGRHSFVFDPHVFYFFIPMCLDYKRIDVQLQSIVLNWQVRKSMYMGTCITSDERCIT